MSSLRCVASRHWRPLLASAAVVLLLVPTPTRAGRNVVRVPAPNGTDDTTSLQAALDACVARGPKCTVQLAAGTYRTSQLVVYGFDGTFAGMGREQTLIEALPDLPVDVPPDDPNPFTRPPNLTDALWPDLVIFVDGNVTVSDLSFRIPSVPATQTWGFFGMEFHEMLSAVRVQMTTKPMNVVIQRIGVEGRPQPEAIFGYNLINCVIVAGEQPAPVIVGEWRLDHLPFTGSVSVADNQFKGCASSDAFSHHTGSRIAVVRNMSQDVWYGVEQANVEDSVVEISGNRVSATQFGVLVYNPYYPPEKRSLFDIRDNHIRLSGPSAWDGIASYDNVGAGERKVQLLLITDNTIEALGIGGGAIHAASTTGTQAWGNRITGSGSAGIWIEAGTRCALVGNAVADFAPGPGSARILLDANTSRCLVAGAYDPTDVLDEGQHNKVILFGGR